jgi:hypothetical protein
VKKSKNKNGERKMEREVDERIKSQILKAVCDDSHCKPSTQEPESGR